MSDVLPAVLMLSSPWRLSVHTDGEAERVPVDSAVPIHIAERILDILTLAKQNFVRV